jgi:hypothetical protein
MADLIRTRGAALAALPFDALPVATEYLDDTDLGGEAAHALIGANENRGLSLVLASIPSSGPNIQRIAFTWFLERYDRLANETAGEARLAALRTLDPVRSTANAEAALYILGLTGSTADYAILQFHAANLRTGSRGMREASQAALVRLGSIPHLERVRSELSRPLEAGATYQQTLALGQALQRAAFSGRAELVPAVCSHINDSERREIDVRIDTGRLARLALNAIVDRVSVTHLSGGRRSAADWVSFCAASPALVP